MEITPEVIEKELKKIEKDAEFPTRNVRWVVDIGSDWVGDPAVWVWLVVDFDSIDSAKRRLLRDRVRTLVRDITRRETGVSWQPYVRFRSFSEERAEAV